MFYMDYVGLFIKLVFNNFFWIQGSLFIDVFIHIPCNSSKYLTIVSGFYPENSFLKWRVLPFILLIAETKAEDRLSDFPKSDGLD